MAWLDTRVFSPFSNFLFQMVVPALLAGGSTGSEGASLTLICEGSAEGVVKRTGGLGEAALTSGGAGVWMALKMTKMGSQSGAWMTRMKRWELLMPPEPSCLLRYPSQDQLGVVAAVPQLPSHCVYSALAHTEGPQGAYSRGARA